MGFQEQQLYLAVVQSPSGWPRTRPQWCTGAVPSSQWQTWTEETHAGCLTVCWKRHYITITTLTTTVVAGSHGTFSNSFSWISSMFWILLITSRNDSPCRVRRKPSTWSLTEGASWFHCSSFEGHGGRNVKTWGATLDCLNSYCVLSITTGTRQWMMCNIKAHIKLLYWMKPFTFRHTPV